MFFGSGPETTTRLSRKSVLWESTVISGENAGLSLLSSRSYTLRPPISSAVAAEQLLHRLWMVMTKAYRRDLCRSVMIFRRCKQQRSWAGIEYLGPELEHLSAQMQSDVV